ncbi:hypothetical protein EDB19DRAFT_1914040 [Suillus lakei]|nr:hypothetical protein EDB19DRAFT_1914040 [Suillus lakei]
MNSRTRPNPYSSAYMGITRCFCGNLTVEDHDFCFCSPECARADALAALGGDDSHYRKIVRQAYVSCGAKAPVAYRRKSKEKTPIAKHVPAILPGIPRPTQPTHQQNQQNMGVQDDRSAKKEKVFPTLAQVTTAILARKAKQGGDPVVETSMKSPQVTIQKSRDALPLPPHPPIQQTRPGLDRGVHKSPLTQLRSAPQRIMPLKVDNTTDVLRAQPSTLHLLAEERGRENTDIAALLRKLDRRAEERAMPPRSQRQVLPNPTVAIPPPGSLRRSASFAGWHSPTKHPDRVADVGESLMELFDQLEDVRTWIEGWDGTPDLNEKAHEA